MINDRARPQAGRCDVRCGPDCAGSRQAWSPRGWAVQASRIPCPWCGHHVGWTSARPRVPVAGNITARHGCGLILAPTRDTSAPFHRVDPGPRRGVVAKDRAAGRGVTDPTEVRVQLLSVAFGERSAHGRRTDARSRCARSAGSSPDGPVTADACGWCNRCAGHTVVQVPQCRPRRNGCRLDRRPVDPRAWIDDTHWGNRLADPAVGARGIDPDTDRRVVRLRWVRLRLRLTRTLNRCRARDGCRAWAMVDPDRRAWALVHPDRGRTEFAARRRAWTDRLWALDHRRRLSWCRCRCGPRNRCWSGGRCRSGTGHRRRGALDRCRSRLNVGAPGTLCRCREGHTEDKDGSSQRS